MKTRFEVFLDTDVYLMHLCGSETESVLLKCLKLFDCYTSVVNASEVFSGCSSNKQFEKVKHSFYGTGVLGIPYKYSFKAGEVLKKIGEKNLKNNFRDALIVTMCSETKLPLFSLDEDRYKDLSKIFNIKLIKKEIIIKNNSPEIIFKKAKLS